MLIDLQHVHLQLNRNTHAILPDRLQLYALAHHVRFLFQCEPPHASPMRLLQLIRNNELIQLAADRLFIAPAKNTLSLLVPGFDNPVSIHAYISIVGIIQNGAQL